MKKIIAGQQRLTYIYNCGQTLVCFFEIATYSLIYWISHTKETKYKLGDSSCNRTTVNDKLKNFRKSKSEESKLDLAILVAVQWKLWQLK